MIRRFSRRLAPLLVAMFAITASLTMATPAVSNADGFAQSIQYTSWGPLTYRLYVPKSLSSASKNVSLLVVLHGCSQDGMSIAKLTRLQAIAERDEIVLLFPEQDQLKNPDQCWNWFLPLNQARGTGEPEMIAELVSSVSAKYPIDRSRRYLIGFSAGAAFASNLASCYPDVFAGVAIHSGLEFRAASTALEARPAMSHGSSFDPILAGRAAAACDFQQGPIMPTIIIHGSADQKVIPLNAEQTLVQFAKMNDILYQANENDSVSSTPFAANSEQVPGGHSYRILDYGPRQHLLLRKIEVDGLRHSWSGGPAGLPNSDPSGPDATAMILDFFKQTTIWREVSSWQRSMMLPEWP